MMIRKRSINSIVLNSMPNKSIPRLLL